AARGDRGAPERARPARRRQRSLPRPRGGADAADGRGRVGAPDASALRRLGRRPMRRDDRHWVGTWTTTPAPAEGAAFSNHTVRMNGLASLGGGPRRVRLSNAYGSRTLVVGAARIGRREGGPGIVPGSDRALTFGGAAAATIAAGALLVSDPVSLPVPP